MRRSRAYWRAFGVTLGLVAACLVGVGYQYGDRLAQAARDYLWRRAHSDGADPVARDLAAGRFPAGSPLANLVAAHPPDQSSGLMGRFEVVVYTPMFRPGGGPPGGAYVVARDGRIAAARVGQTTAHGMVWLYYDLSPADEAALTAAQLARGAAVRAARADALAALGGGAVAGLPAGP